MVATTISDNTKSCHLLLVTVMNQSTGSDSSLPRMGLTYAEAQMPKQQGPSYCDHENTPPPIICQDKGRSNPKNFRYPSD